MRIAGTPLEPVYHNEIGNDMRDGLKSDGIGQSAAENRRFFEVATLVSDVLTTEFVALTVSSSSARSNVFLKVEAQLSLIALPVQVRENVANQIRGNAVAPNEKKDGSAGLNRLGLVVSLSSIGNEFDRGFIAHSEFDSGSVLESNRASVSFEAVDSETSFTVKQSSDVRFSDFIHDDLLLTFNDYPEREYAQVGGSTRLPSDVLYMKEGDIVFSLSKDKAASQSQASAVLDQRPRAKIKPYVGDDYMSIAWPSTLRTFKNTLETLHQYTAAGIQLIFNAEIGRYENVRFTEQTNISKGITSTGSSGTAWSTGLSDWAFFFGEDTVVEGIAVPEEIRAKIPTDYGRSKGVAYYSINGFGLVHNQTDATQSRVVMWDSLA